MRECYSNETDLLVDTIVAFKYWKRLFNKITLQRSPCKRTKKLT